ncbi:MAG: hypothetical protein ABIY50_00720 [Ignavibacteria bacterium]
MNVPKYNIEYSWKVADQIITFIVLCNVKEDNELIGITDEIYISYKKKYKEVDIYYFLNKEDATNFVYLRFVQNKDLKNANKDSLFAESACVGHLLKSKLTGRMSPPKLLKNYPGNY